MGKKTVSVLLAFLFFVNIAISPQTILADSGNFHLRPQSLAQSKRSIFPLGNPAARQALESFNETRIEQERRLVVAMVFACRGEMDKAATIILNDDPQTGVPLGEYMEGRDFAYYLTCYRFLRGETPTPGVEPRTLKHNFVEVRKGLTAVVRENSPEAATLYLDGINQLSVMNTLGRRTDFAELNPGVGQAASAAAQATPAPKILSQVVEMAGKPDARLLFQLQMDEEERILVIAITFACMSMRDGKVKDEALMDKAVNILLNGEVPEEFTTPNIFKNTCQLYNLKRGKNSESEEKAEEALSAFRATRNILRARVQARDPEIARRYLGGQPLSARDRLARRTDIMTLMPQEMTPPQEVISQDELYEEKQLVVAIAVASNAQVFVGGKWQLRDVDISRAVDILQGNTCLASFLHTTSLQGWCNLYNRLSQDDPANFAEVQRRIEAELRARDPLLCDAFFSRPFGNSTKERLEARRGDFEDLFRAEQQPDYAGVAPMPPRNLLTQI